MGSIHPALPMLLGSLLLPFLSRRWRAAVMIGASAFGLYNLLGAEASDSMSLTLAGFELDLLRVDKLSLLFGYLFHIAAFVIGVYSLHVRSRLEHFTALMYAGSAIGAVFAGDLLTLFFFWELLAVTSVFQIWAAGGAEARHAGIRYLLSHITSGLLLLIGLIMKHQSGEGWGFDAMELTGTANWLIFLAFGIKAGFPIAHTWIVDAYPAATATGTLVLSAFTTKVAVYCFARGFRGADELFYIGAVMCIFPIFYAVIENDLRRVLSYSMVNQIGFMLIGIGIGSDLAFNGAVAHAFADVIFKGLLFMTMGAVYMRLGTAKGTDLGGLYKSMPWTTFFCIIGALSISAAPFFSAFVTKTMIMQGAADRDLTWLWMVMLFASSGVLEHAGVKIPFFAFFAHDSGQRPKEAPINMRLAMAVSSVLCILIGVFYKQFYALLPEATTYSPYSFTHVVTQYQLLVFSAVAVFGLMLMGKYPAEVRSVNLDADVIWRKGLLGIWKKGLHPVFLAASAVEERFLAWAPKAVVRQFGHRLPRLPIFKEWAGGAVVVLITLMLGAYLGLVLFA